MKFEKMFENVDTHTRTHARTHKEFSRFTSVWRSVNSFVVSFVDTRMLYSKLSFLLCSSSLSGVHQARSTLHWLLFSWVKIETA